MTSLRNTKLQLNLATNSDNDLTESDDVLTGNDDVMTKSNKVFVQNQIPTQFDHHK